jgi:NAD(P)-dependent dehydrogenase (short-subunit alcohol dehydrogenase family)
VRKTRSPATAALDGAPPATITAMYTASAVPRPPGVRGTLPLLRAAEHPRIVNVSSGAGSFQRILDPGAVENAVVLPVYPATKAALTMLTVQYARALDGILVNAADPGFTGTDFNNHRGTQTVTEGTDAIVHLATLPPDGPTGTFQDRYGPVPW